MASLLLIFFIAIPTIAVASTQTLPAVVVSASRHIEPSPSITTITEDDIENNQYEDLPKALDEASGLSVVQNGGVGNQSSVFIRGSNSNHVLVLIDGIKANNPSSPNGAFDFGQLRTDGIEKIEILRGPQSSQYGSDALGGVINIVTRKGQGKTKVSGTLEAGSFQTNGQSLNAQGEQGRANYNVTVSRLQTGGTVVTPAFYRTKPRQFGADPYQNESMTSRVGADVNDRLRISLFNHYLNTNRKYIYMIDKVNPSYQQHKKQFYNRLQADLNSPDDLWQPSFGASYTDIWTRSGNDIPSYGTPSWNVGNIGGIDWKNRINVNQNYQIDAGVEKEKQSMQQYNGRTNNFIIAKTSSAGGFMGHHLTFFQRVAVDVGARLDHHDNFKDAATYRLSVSYDHLETKTKVFTAYGTGYKAPSLSQLFGIDSGNPNLKPEKNKAGEVGVVQSFHKMEIGSTYFYDSISNLIENIRSPSDPQQFLYTNINQAKIWGFESFASFRINADIMLRVSHTFTHAKDPVSNKQLMRRPQHKITGQLDYQITPDWKMGMGVIYNGKRADSQYEFPYSRVYPGGYTVVRAVTSYNVNKRVQLFGRVENALNRRYENPKDFEQPGVGFYAGIKTVFS